MFEVPKMLYGPRGWADLDDYRLARNAEEEAAAARDGYFRAGEEAREDLVAAGKWPPLTEPRVNGWSRTDLRVSPPLMLGEDGLPVYKNSPKRRGRPPKVA